MYNSQKAMLYGYKEIEEVIGEYSRLIDYSASNSFRTQRTAEVASEILTLIGDKNTLTFVKEKIEEVMSKLTEEERRLISERFFYRKKRKEDVGRTFYRKNEYALYKVVKKMEKAGLTSKFFRDYCLDIPLFEEIHIMLKRKAKMTNRKR